MKRSAAWLLEFRQDPASLLTRAERPQATDWLEVLDDLTKQDLKSLYAEAPASTQPSELVALDCQHTEVIYQGRNSLPFFSRFQKRFVRLEADPRAYLVGYNHPAHAWMGHLTGPGYFVVPPDSPRVGEIFLDYTKLPAQSLPTWPEIEPNNQGISRLVFAGLQDYLRALAPGVFIGAATRGGKNLDQYFILVRSL
jgi:hypothetical protein